MRGDLHCHSRVSDGSLAPGDVVDYAARIGLNCLALTDHDSMNGVAEAAKRAKKRGIRLIPGIEVSAFDYRHGKKVHLLCYAPKQPKKLVDFCLDTLRLRTRASVEMISKVAARYPVDLKTVQKYAAGSAAIYKQHIGLALAGMGYSLTVYGELYRQLFSKKGWAYVEPHYPDVGDALSAIKASGGLAVLAHPGVYGNFDLIDELCGLGLDGIECYHPRQTEDDERAAVEAADAHGLLKTGGSDFHGMYSAHVNPLASRSIQEENLDLFLEALG